MCHFQSRICALKDTLKNLVHKNILNQYLRLLIELSQYMEYIVETIKFFGNLVYADTNAQWRRRDEINGGGAGGGQEYLLGARLF